MLRKTENYMKKHQMVRPGGKLVLGLSGGADSVCLFHVLRGLGFHIEAVHVNHGIRGEEAERDERFAKALCERFSIPFHGYFFDVPAISRQMHWSEEETGRVVRRKAFEEVLEKTGANKIALAHHGNDRAETFLFHLNRGTGLKGLTSMRAVEGCYIRPLLWAERKEIEAYLKSSGHEYVEDSTNRLDCYSRNKIRHQILPVLQQMNAGSVAHICAAAEKLCEAERYIDREAQKLFEKAVTLEDSGKLYLRGEYFEQGDAVLQVPVLQKCIQTVTGSLKDFTEEHYRKLQEMFGWQTGKEINLPAGVAAAKTYQGICIFIREEQQSLQPVEIHGPGEYIFGGNMFVVSIETPEKEKNFDTNLYTKYFDCDKIIGNICLRTRTAGDFLEINKAHGRKSLQDYFVNEKIPRDKRDQVTVLADGNHILWVVGKRISEYYKVNEETKRILKVQWMGGKRDEEV